MTDNGVVKTIKAFVRESRFGQWMLNRACALHLADPRRFKKGPAQCNIWGWIYFRILNEPPVAYSKEYGT